MERGCGAIFAMVHFAVKVMCFYDHGVLQQNVGAACPGLLEFMVADSVFIYVAVCIAGCAMGCLKAGESFGLCLPKTLIVLLCLSIAGMFAGKVAVVQSSWNSETCKNASLTKFSNQSPISGNRVLEIMGWVEIGIQASGILGSICCGCAFACALR
jgi:hypothetical protein